MANTWFWSDPHFDHEKIITLAKRPFTSVKRMNEAMIENHNEVVGHEDTSWCLGDFAWGDNAEYFFSRLHGRKCLIVGNHDRTPTLRLPWHRVEYMAFERMGNCWLHLCHAPLREWYGFHRGAIHLHGHVHGKLADVSGSMDISVERIGYQPISLGEIEKRFLVWRTSGGNRGA